MRFHLYKGFARDMTIIAFLVILLLVVNGTHILDSCSIHF